MSLLELFCHVDDFAKSLSLYPRCKKQVWATILPIEEDALCGNA
jgi:hypothetical protein